MSRQLRLLALTALAALAVTSVVGGSAATGTGHFDTVLKIRKAFPTFHGRAISDSDFCVAGRKVNLYKRKISGHKKLLGQTTTKPNGHWKVEIAAGSGAYFAKAPLYGSASLGIDCGRAKSRTLVID